VISSWNTLEACKTSNRRKPACIYARGNTTWQQSCSHYTAICNQRFNKRIEQSSSFVITLRHHFPPSPPLVPYFYVVYCYVIFCYVMYCHHFTTLRQIYCCVIVFVMWCKVYVM
jgi:hypothetical protein